VGRPRGAQHGKKGDKKPTKRQEELLGERCSRWSPTRIGLRQEVPSATLRRNVAYGLGPTVKRLDVHARPVLSAPGGLFSANIEPNQPS